MSVDDFSDDSLKPSRKLRVVTSLLQRAATLFVRSQLTAVQTLEVDLGGGDRQLLAGSIPRITLAAQGAVYQGLHLSNIQVEGQDIQINLGQVLRGKSLQLMHELQLKAALALNETDLNASFDSPLFDDLLCRLFQAIASYLDVPSSLETLSRHDIQSVEASLFEDGLRLRLLFANPDLEGHCLTARARLVSKNPRILTFRDVRIEFGLEVESPTSEATIPYVPLPLGSDVEIHDLKLTEGALHCQGTIRVRP